MVDRIEWYSVTIPANTPKITPHRTPMIFAQGIVTEIDVKIPPGPAGNVGFYIACGGSQYVPRTGGSFVIPDNDYLTWPIVNAPNAGSWALVAYNTDVWPHLVEVGFQVMELQIGSTLASSLPVSL